MTSDDIKRQIEILEEKHNDLQTLSLRTLEHSNLILGEMRSANECLNGSNKDSVISKLSKKKKVV